MTCETRPGSLIPMTGDDDRVRGLLWHLNIKADREFWMVAGGLVAIFLVLALI